MASTLSATTPTAPHLLRCDPSPPTTTTTTANPTITPSPTPLTATFNYHLPAADGSPPPPSYVSKPETYFRPADARRLHVHDLRGREAEFTLDGQGFQIVRHEAREKEFVDDKVIESVEGYYGEVEELLKRTTGASKIFIFDHTIRRQRADVPGQATKPSTSDSTNTATTTPAPPVRGPVQRVHVDQSYKAGPQRVSHHLPAEAEELLKGRYQIINTWRPIKTVQRDPLAVADATSVAEEDLVPLKLIYPDREGETFTVLPSRHDGQEGEGKGHQWYYLKEQKPDEVLLIKCFDSKEDGRARRAPHTAFEVEGTEGRETRESIEVRALVFHPEDRE